MKRMMLVLFALLIAWMSWEGQKANANLVDQGPIPQESIRLRIIANSDSIADQWLKREVRDEIVKEMNTWVSDVDSYETAVSLVSTKLPELQQIVDQTIKDRGFHYPAIVDFGQVPFPTKQYGAYTYPAGDYTALRVRIGEAKGQNWWCVLFPPLCFIDIANGDAVAAATVTDEPSQSAPEQRKETDSQVDDEKVTTGESSRDGETSQQIEETTNDSSYMERATLQEERMHRFVDNSEDNSENAEISEIVSAEPSEPAVEVRFFLLDRLAAWF